MKTSISVILTGAVFLGILATNSSFASKYPKKKPPISQMMLGGTSDAGAKPNPDATAQPIVDAPASAAVAPVTDKK